MKSLVRLTLLAALAAFSLVAADVNGAWKAVFTTPDGQQRENTINLKADSGKISGTVASPRGESQIKEGTIDGDDLTFTVVRNFGGEDITFTYKGKVAGNKIVFKVSAGDREYEMTAIKQ